MWKHQTAALCVLMSCRPGSSTVEQHRQTTQRPMVQQYAMGSCFLRTRSINILTFGRETLTIPFSFEQPLVARDAFERIRKEVRHRGTLLAIVNAGFFNESSGAPISPHKTAQKLVHGIKKGKRPCVVFQNDKLHSFETDHRPNNDPFSSPESTYACAGPMLFHSGQNTLRQSLIEGEFIPESRSDRQDPLNYRGHESRAALCRDRSGRIQLFIALALPTCGFTLEDMSVVQKEMGCVDGMALDGGRSVSAAYTDEKDVFVLESPMARHIPVWLAFLSNE